MTRKELLMENQSTPSDQLGQSTDDRYRVVLLDGGGQCAGWLSNRLALVNAAWESGEWTYEQAQVNATHANRAIRKGMSPLCRWYPVPVRLDDTREHYGAMADEAHG